MKKIFVVLAFILFVTGCKKNQLGGKSTVQGTVIHHTTSIPYARVFVKFNATDLPGTDTLKYDHKLSADAQGKFSFKCYKGNYYIYAVGKDPNSIPPTVVGGTPVKVRSNEVVDVTIAVTED